MNERLIILRDLPVNTSTFKPTVKGGGGSSGPVTYRLDVASTDPREIPEIRKESDVAAVAVAMPLRLYQPMKRARVGAESVRPWGLEAVRATESVCSGAGATIAVLDTGIHAAHEAFADLGDRLVQEDFTGDGNTDVDGHGTHCCGVAFGGKVRGTQIGVAPGVERALVGKVIGRDGATTEQLAKALDWALGEGAHVVSMSIGIDFPSYSAQLIRRGLPPEFSASLAMERQVETLELFEAIAQRGRTMGRPLIFVAAAGNSSRYNVNPAYVMCLEPPAAARGFLAVSAVERTSPELENEMRIADFSNGRAAVCGPGVDIVSAEAGTKSGLIAMSGTSMATPHVAGVAALWVERMISSGEDFNWEVLTSHVRGKSVSERIAPDRRVDAGSGLVQAPLSPTVG